MPAGPIGSHWTNDTWPDTAWEAGSWGGTVTVLIGTSLQVLGLAVAGLTLTTPTGAGLSVTMAAQTERVASRVTVAATVITSTGLSITDVGSV
jgi:predicted benzoate:H+ symporter BenE